LNVSSPDPVGQPQAYQAYLLGLLGDEDPAAVQAATPAALRALVHEASPHLRDRPAPGEWSVFGCLAHVTDAELVMSVRYRFVLAEDEPHLVGYDQDRWVDRLHGGEGSPQALLEVFDTLRAANLALWAATSPQDRGRVGLHAERGPESFDLAFRMIAGHDRFHLTQARNALDGARI
jgi:hypothetical protein